MIARYATCDDVIDAFKLARHHCESCHQDYDAGVPMCTRTTLTREQHFCCDVSRQLGEMSDDEFFDALDAWLKLKP